MYLARFLTGLTAAQQLFLLCLLFALLDGDNLSVRLFELRSFLFRIIVIEVEFGACFDVGSREEGDAKDGVTEQVFRTAVGIFFVGVVDETQLVAHVCRVDFLFCTLLLVPCIRYPIWSSNLLEFSLKRYIVF
jgi:hypothetical protein